MTPHHLGLELRQLVLRERLAGLIGQIARAPRKPDAAVLKVAIPSDKQHRFGQIVLEAMGFDTGVRIDGLIEAQHKQAILSRGASVHGLPALRKFPGNQWLQVALMRVNHNGTRMDAED